MPVSFGQIIGNTAEITVRVGESTATIAYYPAKITEKVLSEVNAFSSNDFAGVVESFGSLNEILADLIKSWDVYEDDAQTTPFPLAPDRLADLPIMFRVQVLKAIIGDIRPESLAAQTLN